MPGIGLQGIDLNLMGDIRRTIHETQISLDDVPGVQSTAVECGQVHLAGISLFKTYIFPHDIQLL